MRIIQAVVVAIFVTLLCLLLGALILTLPFPAAAVLGGWLVKFAYVLGLLAGLWHFAAGAGWIPRWGTRPGPP